MSSASLRDFYRLGDDCVAVMVIEDHGVLAAAIGGDGEAASLVRVDFASQSTI